MHDGCNARVWLHVHGRCAPTVSLPRAGTRFYTPPRRACPTAHRLRTRRETDDGAARRPGRCSSRSTTSTLHSAHNEIAFYTWGDRRCCLPAGATRATLAGHLPRPRGGRRRCCSRRCCGPLTGEPADADPAHRHVVRLTDGAGSSRPTIRPRRVTDPLTGDRDHRDRMGAGGRAAVPALRLVRHRRASTARTSSTR